MNLGRWAGCLQCGAGLTGSLVERLVGLIRCHFIDLTGVQSEKLAQATVALLASETEPPSDTELLSMCEGPTSVGPWASDLRALYDYATARANARFEVERAELIEERDGAVEMRGRSEREAAEVCARMRAQKSDLRQRAESAERRVAELETELAEARGSAQYHAGRADFHRAMNDWRNELKKGGTDGK
jgi:hypothetical protein